MIIKTPKTKPIKEIYNLRITTTQKQTLEKLKFRRVKVSEFIRIAIKEKIERDYSELKEKPKNIKCPF